MVTIFLLWTWSRDRITTGTMNRCIEPIIMEHTLPAGAWHSVFRIAILSSEEQMTYLPGRQQIECIEHISLGLPESSLQKFKIH